MWHLTPSWWQLPRPLSLLRTVLTFPPYIINGWLSRYTHTSPSGRSLRATPNTRAYKWGQLAHPPSIPSSSTLINEHSSLSSSLTSIFCTEDNAWSGNEDNFFIPLYPTRYTPRDPFLNDDNLSYQPVKENSYSFLFSVSWWKQTIHSCNRRQEWGLLFIFRNTLMNIILLPNLSRRTINHPSSFKIPRLEQTIHSCNCEQERGQLSTLPNPLVRTILHPNPSKRAVTYSSLDFPLRANHSFL